MWKNKQKLEKKTIKLTDERLCERRQVIKKLGVAMVVMVKRERERGHIIHLG